MDNLLVKAPEKVTTDLMSEVHSLGQNSTSCVRIQSSCICVWHCNTMYIHELNATKQKSRIKVLFCETNEKIKCEREEGIKSIKTLYTHELNATKQKSRIKVLFCETGEKIKCERKEGVKSINNLNSRSLTQLTH